jgi:predicted short-subunit dehydrogenase-like oxidoreductase (DUF2520 family)
MMGRSKITVIGAGRVGSAIAKALFNSNYTIQSIISSSIEDAKSLASATNAIYSNQYSISDDTDIVIIAVPDSNISSVADQLDIRGETVVVHTAGSVGFDIFPEMATYGKGVLYPLQTFTKSREFDLTNIPIFIEGDSDQALSAIREVANSLSERVMVVGLEKRRRMHLAAVFVSNFVNYLLSTGYELASEAELDFHLLEPLVKETIDKAFEIGPLISQTGPAVRNDSCTIEKHRDLLSYHPELRKIYNLLTDSIINKYSSENNDQF